MSNNGTVTAGSPGLIKIDCPEEGCNDVHRIPIHISFQSHVDDTGTLDLTIHPPEPLLSKFRDHMAFEHGRF